MPTRCRANTAIWQGARFDVKSIGLCLGTGQNTSTDPKSAILATWLHRASTTGTIKPRIAPPVLTIVAGISTCREERYANG